MRNIIRYSTQYLKDTQGAVLPLVGVSLVVLLLFTAVSVDGGRFFMARSKLSASLDAAVIAAADIATKNLNSTTVGQAEIEERGRQFFRANFPTGYMGTTIEDNDVEITFDSETGTVAGSVRGDLPLTFGGIFSMVGSSQPNLTIDAYSEVVRSTGGRRLEIAIAVDQSSSMCFALGTGGAWGNAIVDDPNCENYAQVKIAVNTLVNSVTDAVDAVDPSTNPLGAFFSYIPFSHAVRIDGSTDNFNFVLDGLNPSNIDRVKSVLGLTNDADSIRSLVNVSTPAIDEISTEGGTNYALGLWWAWASLRSQEDDPDVFSLFKGASAHQDPAQAPSSLSEVANRNVTKVLVMLTDGNNEYPSLDRTPPYEVLSGDEGGFVRDLAADERLENMCEQIKREDTLLCTIAFNVPVNSPVATNLTSCATRDCAFNAQSFEDLQRAFDEIGNRVIDKRITQ